MDLSRLKPAPPREPVTGDFADDLPLWCDLDTDMVLSQRQQPFAYEIARGRSGAAAAREAGYAVSSARQQAYRLMTNDDIRRQIEKIRAHGAAARRLATEALLCDLRALFADARAASNLPVALRCLLLESRLAERLYGAGEPPPAPADDTATPAQRRT